MKKKLLLYPMSNKSLWTRIFFICILVFALAEAMVLFNQENLSATDFFGFLNWVLLGILTFFFYKNQNKMAHNHYILIDGGQLCYKHKNTGLNGTIALADIQELSFHNRTVILKTKDESISLPYDKNSFNPNRALELCSEALNS